MTIRAAIRGTIALGLLGICGRFPYMWADAAPPKLKKIPSVAPDKALDTLHMARGFRVEQVAAEPLVRDPVAMEFDENGYAYLLELPPYNAHAKPDADAPGYILRLEDSDGDGRFDKRVVFAEGLKYPSGLMCYDGGLYVGDSPDLIYLRDADGDGRADERKVLYTGFGTEMSGEGRLNSFRWGLDNCIHIAANHDGGEVHPVDAPAGPSRAVRNRILLLDPRTNKIELMGGSGQHGMTFDDWGRTLVCENSNPFILLMYDDRYLTRNPLMSAPSPLVSITEDGMFTKLMRLSEVDPWRVIRLEMRMTGKYPGPTEGGNVSGFFTAATGVTFYRGDAWPAEYRDSVLVGEAANNLIYRARLKTDGLDVVSQRADTDAEFLACSDTWFRPVQFANAPDGTLYFLDMYRELIETALALPPDVLAQMDPLAGTDMGRIYRIVPDGYKPRPRVKLGAATTAELVATLENPNGWHRDTASRLLFQRQDKAAVAPLRKLANESPSPQARVHALWALAGLDALSQDDVLQALADEHPRVREHAVRLAEQFAESSPAVAAAMTKCSSDADDWVRFQAAFSLGYLPAAARIAAIVDLMRRDGESPWMRMAAQSSLGVGAPETLTLLVADERFRQSPGGKEFLQALAGQVGRGRKPAELTAVVKAIDSLDAKSQGPLVRSLVVSLLAGGRGAPAEQLRTISQGEVKAAVSQLLGDARRTALNDGKAPAARAAAIRLLACDKIADVRPDLEQLLDARQPPPVQEAALGVLSLTDDPTVPELLLQRWRGLTPQVRAGAAEALCSRAAWTKLLLAAVESGDIAAADIEPARIALLQSHADAEVREAAARVFAKPSNAARAEVVAEYQQALELSGDVDRGRAAFRKVCASCHQLEGFGTVVGANLQAIADRGQSSIVLNMLDPNREINPKFLTYVVSTEDGRAIAGIITAETANEITLRTPDGATVSLSRAEIDDVTSTGLSYMPEGLEKQIDVQTMADLLAYFSALK